MSSSPRTPPGNRIYVAGVAATAAASALVNAWSGSTLTPQNDEGIAFAVENAPSTTVAEVELVKEESPEAPPGVAADVAARLNEVRRSTAMRPKTNAAAFQRRPLIQVPSVPPEEYYQPKASGVLHTSMSNEEMHAVQNSNPGEVVDFCREFDGISRRRNRNLAPLFGLKITVESKGGSRVARAFGAGERNRSGANPRVRQLSA